MCSHDFPEFHQLEAHDFSQNTFSNGYLRIAKYIEENVGKSASRLPSTEIFASLEVRSALSPNNGLPFSSVGPTP